MALPQQLAYFTHEECSHAGHLYYFAPANRAAGPYKRQIEVKAILDIADDGMLAGVEVIDGDVPPPRRAAAMPCVGCPMTRPG